MNWEKAYELIVAKITKGRKLSLESKYRVVLEVPSSYKCYRYDYNGSPGFKISIGETTDVEIPISMLHTIFNDIVANNGVYNKDVFRKHYPTRAEESTGHPCHIHVVGKIFELSGIAIKKDNRIINC